ncbi:hypothetical protein [Streptomyces griseocarneus]|uniref:hypothetical protein n=1 Tax=Streptomyces griseocarneus TaxID=51201 RepID=UPI001F60731B|nr:hypothetical protein [Streptomyces griseocarneus]
MRKKRLRGGQREQQTSGVPERTARVRNRLIASVAVVSLTALGAGAFGIADAIRDLGDSRRLAALATSGSGAVALVGQGAALRERAALDEFAPSPSAPPRTAAPASTARSTSSGPPRPCPCSAGWTPCPRCAAAP